MMTDLEIAQRAEILKIKEIAKKINLSEEDIELYGNYKAKINPELLRDKKEKAKLILVTAINPTPAGEGKSTVTIGLADALNRLNNPEIIVEEKPVKKTACKKTSKTTTKKTTTKATSKSTKSTKKSTK
jgi:formate--tetrahydrofolate ligase